MFIELLIIIIIASYLRRSLKSALNYPEWNKRFLYIIYISCGLMILPVVISKESAWLDLLGAAILGSFLYIVNKEELFKPYRFF